MKIAVPVTEDYQIDNHFGHCKAYYLFTIAENNEITDVQTLDSEPGCGCKSNIATTLAERGVKILLAGGIGNGAISVINKAGIEVVRGCSGNAAEAVKLYVSGLLKDGGESCHQHENHNEEGGHVCSH